MIVAPDKSLRPPLQDVYKIGGIGTEPVGRVSTHRWEQEAGWWTGWSCLIPRITASRPESCSRMVGQPGSSLLWISIAGIYLGDPKHFKHNYLAPPDDRLPHADDGDSSQKHNRGFETCRP